jgi:hypothetical protein
MGLPTFDCEAHVPMLVTKTSMLTVFDILAGNVSLENRSLYGNLTGLPGRVAADVKLRNPANRHRDEPWASTQGDPDRYPNPIGRVPNLDR